MIRRLGYDAKDSEYDEIVRISDESFPVHWSADDYKNLNSQLTNKLLVCEDCDKNICGFVLFSEVLGEVEIYRIATAPEYRRMGVGEMLMEAAIKYYATYKIVLEVRVDNEPAIALYKKMGLTCLGVRKRYYENGDDAFIFGRKYI